MTTPKNKIFIAALGFIVGFLIVVIPMRIWNNADKEGTVPAEEKIGTVLKERAQKQEVEKPLRLHVYDDPAISLDKIVVKTIVFIPKSSVYAKTIADHKQYYDQIISFLTTAVIPPINQFHEREFSGASKIRFDIYSDVVYGRQEASTYELKFLQKTKEGKLAVITNELHERIFLKSGDLYREDFSGRAEGEYMILFIVYASRIPLNPYAIEAGVGIAGLAADIGTTIVVFSPMFEPEGIYNLNAASVVYHELAHAMGAPEQYDQYSADMIEQRNARADIMGIGASEPLLTTYLGKDIKVQMGWHD
ncbi:MAG: hypothetical protein A2939_03585 [Parcubacteria group bacterium RIFCSPLOWO2_01_FULL_48_18]|nr:MAG: hypothetical protein A2939_03585 [Parcubacteria group bacterium RIFCSPLOWO2_01_FULL_48_18]OHB22594.1 MAG: hypothetical protein A3J67_00840 [Parcubacteria group bacterium RIFCSPHIGHO2_02_FULL_48_10b]